jgi:hypothetical protein
MSSPESRNGQMCPTCSYEAFVLYEERRKEKEKEDARNFICSVLRGEETIHAPRRFSRSTYADMIKNSFTPEEINYINHIVKIKK